MLRLSFFWGFRAIQHCDFFFGFPSTHTSKTGPPSANAALPPHTHLQTSYSPSAHFVTHPLGTFPTLQCFWLFFYTFCFLSLPPLTRSGFFNEIPEVFKPKVLYFSTLFPFIPQNLFVSRKKTSNRLFLSGSQDIPLWDPIALTASLKFFLLMTGTPAVLLSFSSRRACPSLNFLPPLSPYA